MSKWKLCSATSLFILLLPVVGLQNHDSAYWSGAFAAAPVLAKPDSNNVSASQLKANTTDKKTLPRNSFMWRVSSDKCSVYVLGSIHLVPDGFYPLPAEVEHAFDKSSVLVLEIDPNKEDPVALQQLMLSKGKFPTGDSMQKHISKDTLDLLQKYALKSGQPLAGFMTMRPWFAAMFIPMAELQKNGFDPKNGIDRHFAQRAQSDAKPVDQVESAQFQLELLSGFSEDIQEKLLRSALLEVSEIKQRAGLLTQAWKAGSASQMDSILTKDEREHPELKSVSEKLIYDRNVGMAKKIEGYLETGKRHFIVVGAAHVVGDRGIIKLLQDKNYRIEQVPIAGTL